MWLLRSSGCFDEGDSVRFPPLAVTIDPLRTLEARRYLAHMRERANGSENPPWRGGYVLAITLGCLTVGLYYGGFTLIRDLQMRPFPLELWPYLFLQVMLASVAFAYLARKGIRSRLPWLVAVGVTAAFWASLFVIELQSLRSETGATISMGWLMLMSPLVIASAALLTEKVSRGR